MFDCNIENSVIAHHGIFVMKIFKNFLSLVMLYSI